MATRESNGQKPSTYRRELVEIQLSIYRRIVERKHGLSVPLPADAVSAMSDEDLASYVDTLRDMAHLPPA